MIVVTELARYHVLLDVVGIAIIYYANLIVVFRHVLEINVLMMGALDVIIRVLPIVQ